jgi:hypothetical protein
MTEFISRDEEALALRLAASQPESTAEFNDLIGRIRDRVVSAALSNERVQRRLADNRHRVVAVDYREDKSERGEPPRLAEVGIYDYSQDVLVVVAMDLHEGGLVDLFDRPGSAPPITAEELTEATALLQQDSHLARVLDSEGVRIVAFPTPNYAFEGQRQRHRGATVYAQPVDGDEIWGTVDLSALAVVPDDELPEILQWGPRRPSAE